MNTIRIFLGAYVNFPNAQNINCDNIARHLDKERFEVHVMYTDKLPIDKEAYRKADVHLHRLIHHRFIWYWCKLLTMLFGNYDVYYLPKQEPMDRLFARLMRARKPIVASVEGVITATTNNDPAFRRYYTDEMNSFFSISNCIAASVKEYWGIDSLVLPLGVSAPGEHVPHKRINKILWVGNVKANKRPLWLVECARAFPEISFEMLGDGDMMEEIREKIRRYGLSNVKMFGRVPNEQVYERLSKGDLLLMTSEYEGLPKVIQEAACCGVPSVYVSEHYTVDIIQSGVNGYAVSGLGEMKDRIQYLLDHPDEYSRMSQAAEASIQPYLWPKLIKQYEDYFSTLVRKKAS